MIRTGIIHCDLHALYYAALMGGYDPVELRDDTVARGQSAFFYHYLQYNNPRTITSPTVDGFKLVRFWDPDRAQAQAAARIFNSRDAIVCDSFAEVSDDVDLVFIANCNGDGSDHLTWATPGLQKRVPTFIDKPLAYEYGDAKELAELAQENDVPMLSLSMLGQTPHALRFRNRFAELDGPEFGTIKGGGTAMAGHIHAIGLAQCLFGTGVQAVECMGRNELGFVHLSYGDMPGRPKAGVVLNCDSGGSYHCSMYASAYSRLGAIHSPPIGDFEFPQGAARILGLVKQMVQTGAPPVPYDAMLECIAIATAARLAQRERRQIAITEVTG